jgi:hypothetical protein
VRYCGRITFIAALFFLVFLLIFSPEQAHGQTMEPRLYSNAPVGMNFLILGYGYQWGDVLLDPTLPVQDVNIDVHSPFAAYSRFLDVWGKSGKIDLILPYALLSGTGTVRMQEKNRNISGFADPAVRFSVNLYGAPALLFKEFQQYQQDIIIGVSLLVTAPLGQYDSSKLVNIGTNRWSFKPELGISKTLGRWTLESAAGVMFFTNNNSFMGRKTREQDPVYSVQGHVIYNFRSGVWAGLDGTYYAGGTTSIDGARGDDILRSWRIGATVAIPFDIRNSIKLYCSTGVQTRSGGNFDIVGIAWQYRWGGGI